MQIKDINITTTEYILFFKKKTGLRDIGDESVLKVRWTFNELDSRSKSRGFVLNGQSIRYINRKESCSRIDSLIWLSSFSRDWEDTCIARGLPCAKKSHNSVQH